MVIKLVKAGADLNILGGASETPLQWAITSGANENIFYDFDRNNSAKLIKFNWLFRVFLEIGEEIIAEYLIKSGANVNIKTPFNSHQPNCTALHFASARGNGKYEMAVKKKFGKTQAI